MFKSEDVQIHRPRLAGTLGQGLWLLVANTVLTECYTFGWGTKAGQYEALAIYVANGVVDEFLTAIPVNEGAK